MLLNCVACGVEFESPRLKRHCSAKCRNRFNRKTPRECVVCKKSFMSEHKKAKLCSTECVSVWAMCRNPGYVLSCQRCGCSFRKKSNRHNYNKYCSRECYFGVAKKGRMYSSERPRKIGPAVRRRIADRDKWRCRLCGIRVLDNVSDRHPRKLNVDHVIPLSRGGGGDDCNLQCLCRSCNSSKADKVLNLI